MFKCSELYEVCLNATEDLIIMQGGTSSGKTYSIMQVLFSIAIREKCSILVVGQSVPNLKVGAMTDAEIILSGSEELQQLVTSFNKTDRIYEFSSGSTIQFKSFMDYQDAKSGKRDYTFFNEVNGIPKPIFDEIHLRTRIRTWVDYNPNEEFWIHTNYKDQPNTKFIRSWYVHNPFLSQKIIDKIEALKDQDEELWKVYGLGKTGKVEGLIFRNWAIKTSVPEGAEYIGSWLDWGYTNDPTTAGDVWKSDGELYLEEKLYQTGLTNPDIFAKLDKSSKYIADSAEPKSIEELKRMGLSIRPSLKGKDSIKTGIDILKRYKLNLIGANLVKEFKSYKWKTDRKTNEPINEPVDFLNHHIDGIRYVALLKLRGKGRGKYNVMRV